MSSSLVVLIKIRVFLIFSLIFPIVIAVDGERAEVRDHTAFARRHIQDYEIQNLLHFKLRVTGKHVAIPVPGYVCIFSKGLFTPPQCEQRLYLHAGDWGWAGGQGGCGQLG